MLALLKWLCRPFFAERDGEWHSAENPTRMRRYTPHGWEYREANEAEEAEQVSKDGW